ncbi:MAG: immune inhibitor A [Anaerolineae bacterium]|nr:immune inhibitor A [Anaerolineae bacterium]
MNPIRILVAALLALTLSGPLKAAPDRNTATELAEAIPPPRDRIDLARRLMGIETIAPPPATPPQWQLGDVQRFWVTNEYDNRAFQVDASLRTIGEHIYFWVEQDVTIDTAELDKLAAIFDQDIYTPMHALWGSEDSPGVDGDPRVYGLFAFGQGPGVAAYFASEHIYPVEAVSTSNEHEMFFFNLDTLGTAFPADMIAGVVAHEFQHMIQEHQDTNESIWLNEGFSKFSEIYVNYPFSSASSAIAFLSQPGTQLDDWPEEGSTLPHYGAGLMFVAYFYDRYGIDALRQLGRNPASGLESVDAVLKDLGEPGVNTFFADWVLANFLQNYALTDGRYGYQSLFGLTGPAPMDLVSEYPYRWSGAANQYSTDYFVFNHLNSAQTLDIRLDAPQTTRLVPADASSGQRMWYSNRADNSDTTLTRRFDLSGVAGATLNYNIWYHLEHLWDYGYVMVSTDEGQTWGILNTPAMTDENPHNNAYGLGYTGSSEGWLAEQISLDAYVGKAILVRFETITDDATTQPGMLIDDVRIPEVGYASDFEADGGGWEPRGWIWTDNTLAQQVWVQAVQQIGTDATITRWLVPDESHWSLPLEPNVEQVTLAISPFAPLTTVALPYTLEVEVP